MDQSLALEYLVKNKGKLESKVYVLPEEVDKMVAHLQLDALGIQIDNLTPEQQKYLSSWNEGT